MRVLPLIRGGENVERAAMNRSVKITTFIVQQVAICEFVPVVTENDRRMRGIVDWFPLA